MKNNIKRSKEEMERCYERTVDSVYKTCRMFFKGNIADIEDAVQSTYVQWMTSDVNFENENHEKAWLIVTASNICKNTLKHWWRRNENIDDVEQQGRADKYEEDNLITMLRKLPEKQRVAMYMFYYEGYTCKEIAEVMGKKEATVWEYLHNGRVKLKTLLEDERYA